MTQSWSYKVQPPEGDNSPVIITSAISTVGNGARGGFEANRGVHTLGFAFATNVVGNDNCVCWEDETPTVRISYFVKYVESINVIFRSNLSFLLSQASQA